jgi:2-dehydropantoate 2-reductase
LYIQIGKESVRVGQALDYQIEPINGVAAEVWARADEGDALEELDAVIETRGDPENWRSSMAQDVDKDRKTEVNQMNGFIVEKGMETGIATPVNEAVVRLITDIESGKVKPDPSHADRILGESSR